MRGGYGLAVTGLDGTDRLGEVGVGWPTLTVRQHVEAPTEPTAGARHFDLGTGAAVTVHRHGGGFATDLYLGGIVPDDHLVHPYLSFPAAVANHWAGREVFHAGGVVVGGRVWALCGRPGDGKTSTLAWLHGRRHPVTTDDLLVVDAGTAYTGPRCLDLRGETAAHLGFGEAMGVVGTRERWRVPLGSVPPSHRLGGWVYLAWGEEVAIEPVPPAQRLARIFQQDGLGWGPSLPSSYLGLAALPAWDLYRPRHLGTLDEVGRLLVGVLTAAAARS